MRHGRAKGQEAKVSDELKKDLEEMAVVDGIELSDEVLDAIVGGYIYHDEGDLSAHRKEAYYVLDDKGQVVMRLDSLSSAEHWAGNLRTSAKLINADEFEKMRRSFGSR